MKAKYQELSSISSHGGGDAILTKKKSHGNDLQSDQDETNSLSSGTQFTIETDPDDEEEYNETSEKKLKEEIDTNFELPSPSEFEKNNDFDQQCFSSSYMFFSALTFSWMRPLLELGNKRPLETSDLFPLFSKDTSDHIYNQFVRSWLVQTSKTDSNKISFPSAIVEAFGYPFFLVGILKFGYDSCIFIGPLLLNRVINFLKDPSIPMSQGLIYVAMFFCSQTLMAFGLRQYFWWCFRVGMRLRSAVITAVYNKSLVLSTSALSRRSTGEITNLMQVDSTRLQDLTPYLHAVWYSVFQITIALVLLWQQVGAACLAGLILLVVNNGYYYSWIFYYRHDCDLSRDTIYKTSFC